jgi:predicted nucleic acid-binding Zn ribbon protein
MRSAEKTEKCSFCGGKAHRIVSMSSFILKGSGWYVTDYKKTHTSDKTTAGQKAKGGKAQSVVDKESKEAKEVKESTPAVLDKASNV